MAVTSTYSQLELLKDICQAIVDKKGMNVLTLDVSSVSTMTDYFVIAEGNVERHVKALADYIEEVCDKHGVKIKHYEGSREGEWIVLDLVDIVVHLFTPELRHRYSLEEVWREGKIISFPLNYGR